MGITTLTHNILGCQDSAKTLQKGSFGCLSNSDQKPSKNLLTERKTVENCQQILPGVFFESF